jgi:hypothetical protein
MRAFEGEKKTKISGEVLNDSSVKGLAKTKMDTTKKINRGKKKK